jgi:hypothetical protein
MFYYHQKPSGIKQQFRGSAPTTTSRFSAVNKQKMPKYRSSSDEEDTEDSFIEATESEASESSFDASPKVEIITILWNLTLQIEKGQNKQNNFCAGFKERSSTKEDWRGLKILCNQQKIACNIFSGSDG